MNIQVPMTRPTSSSTAPAVARPAKTAPVSVPVVALPADPYVSARQPAQETGDGQFTWGEAALQFAKGLAHPVLSLLDGFKRSPLQTIVVVLGGAALLGALTVGLPLLLPVLGLGAIAPFVIPAFSIGSGVVFGLLGAFKLVTSGKEAKDRYDRGDYDGAERAFEGIGQGAFDLVSSVMSALQGVKGFKAALEARRALAAAPAVKAATTVKQAATVVSEVERQKAALLKLEQRVATFAPGGKLSARGEAAIQSDVVAFETAISTGNVEFARKSLDLTRTVAAQV